VILAVFDCNMLISAIGWGGNPRACLHLVAAGQVTLCLTPEIWTEYDQRVPEVLADKKPGVDARPMLDWILRTATMVEPAPLGKQRSRDRKDDRYLACALSAGAKLIVTSDRDLLDLEKPFGIKMVTPVELLLRIRGKTKQ
jgi:putative PIN family toxin of toxin-antitoxin system